MMQETVERSNIGVWQAEIQEQRTIRIAVSPREIPRDASHEQAEFMRRYPMSAIMDASLVARGRILGEVSLVHYGRQSPYTEEEEELTERREVEKRLKASKERFRGTFE